MSNENIFVKSEDKVILSDFLFTVYNGFMNHPKNVIVETCVNFYDEETIWNEKIRFSKLSAKKQMRDGPEIAKIRTWKT